MAPSQADINAYIPLMSLPAASLLFLFGLVCDIRSQKQFNPAERRSTFPEQHDVTFRKSVFLTLAGLHIWRVHMNCHINCPLPQPHESRTKNFATNTGKNK
jgi:hypothetical protein